MVRLKILLCSMMALCPSALHGASLAQWQPHVASASIRFGMPENWILRVMQIESGGQTMLDGRPIRSHAGAMGLMQIMPGTWTALSRRHGLGDDPDEPRANIFAGAAYLREMYDRFGYPGLFAAYNAGPARYARHLAGKASLPRETIAYLRAAGGTLPATAYKPTLARQAIFVAAVRATPAALQRDEDRLFLIRRHAGVKVWG